MKFTITTQNVFGLRDIDWTPEGVCVLVGPNGSGKTTLLSLLPLLGVAADRTLAKALALSGGAEGLRHLSCSSEKFPKVSVQLQDAMWTLELDEQGGVLDPNHGEFFVVAGETLYDRYLSTPQVQYDGNKVLEPRGAVVLGLFALSTQDPRCEPMLQLAREARAYGEYRIDELIRHGSPNDPEARLLGDGTNLFSLLRNWRDARSTQNRYATFVAAIQRAFPQEFEAFEFLPAGSGFTTRVFRPGASHSLPIRLASRGLLTAMLHLAAVLGTNDGGYVAIDELENALHPAAIRSLLDTIHDEADARDLTVVIATHSPEVLDAFSSTPDNVFVFDDPTRQQPTRLSKLKDPSWLAHFQLGTLYQHGDFGGIPAIETNKYG